MGRIHARLHVIRTLRGPSFNWSFISPGEIPWSAAVIIVVGTIIASSCGVLFTFAAAPIICTCVFRCVDAPLCLLF